MIGGATGRQQADDSIDDGLLVIDAADGAVLIAEGGDRQCLLRRLDGNRIAQWRARIDEGRARQVQAHDLHQHLVGIGRAIEGAGAGAVIGFAFGLKQLIAPHLAFGEELADPALLIVRQAAGHWPGGNEDGGQMAK